MVSLLFFNDFMSVLTLLSFVAFAAVLLLMLSKKHRHQIIQLAHKYGNHVIFVLSLAGMLGSLFFSEVMGYEPCRLCWYMRILLYPQVLISGIAIWRKRYDTAEYILPLTILGLGLAAYHYSLQIRALMDPNFVSSCGATAVSCSAAQFVSFGFVTIPLMAFASFLWILFISIIHLRTVRA